jgi:hypothetical protein
MNQRDPRLELLIDRYIGGRLSPDEQAELQHRLRDDDKARTRFVAVLDLHAMLVANAALAAADTRKLARQPPTPARSWVLKGSAVCLAVAAAGLVIAVTWNWARPQVRLLRVVGYEFVGGDPALDHRGVVGQSFELPRGFVELDFRQADATVVIEGPAKFRVEDARTLRVESGRIAAHVRDGRQGLHVVTPHASVVDLGTRFGVDVTKGRGSEVHVFEGRVTASGVPGPRTPYLLTAKKALRFDGTSSRPCDPRMGGFVHSEELLALGAGLRAGQDKRALAAFARLKADPAILVAIDFEKPANEAWIEIVGPRPVQGRFPGKRALDFVEADDRVHLDWRAQARQFTLMLWVRLNSTLDLYNSLYHTDGWGTMGQVHLMVMGDGELAGHMRFAIHGGAAESAPIWAVSKQTLWDKLDRWTHLAVVYDADLGSVALYVNGQLDVATDIPKSLTAVLGPGEIGNWSPIRGRPRRRFSGRMDEFVILSRALSAAEIAAYYRESSPYR